MAKGPSPQLLLNFDEYCETWRALLGEYYNLALEGNITETLLGLDEDALGRYSLELSTVLLVIANLTWRGSKGMTEEAKEKVLDAVAPIFYQSIYEESHPDFAAECEPFYRQKLQIFSQICKNLADKDGGKRKQDLVGLTRYLTAQASSRPERENLEAIERIGVLLVSFNNACLHLAKNSSLSLQGLGKPKFVVQKMGG